MSLPNDVARFLGVGDDEGWREIPGYAGAYSASINGEIKSSAGVYLSRNQFGEFPVKRKGTILSQKTTSDGYMRLCVGHHQTKLVHHLVALAFIGTRPYGHQVNHIDGNKKNNKPNNLEYVTCAENILHARAVLGVGIQRGESNGNSKLGKADIQSIIKDERLQRIIAADYGVTQSTISKIKRGASWR